MERPIIKWPRIKAEDPLCVGRDELSDIELYWLDKANKEKC